MTTTPKQRGRTDNPKKHQNSYVDLGPVEISVDEVLFDVREFPLTRAEFKKYLEEVHAEENLDFWVEIQKYKEGRLKETSKLNGKEVRVIKDPEAVEDVPDAKTIVENFVGEKAKVVYVNLSSSLTDQLLGASEAELPSKFNEAQREVRGMMTGDMFYRFVREKLSTNISTSEANFRTRIGVVTSLLAVLLAVLLRLFAPIPSYAVFLISLPGTWMGVYFIASGQMKTCAGKGLTGKVMPGEVTWWQERGLSTFSPREFCKQDFASGTVCDLTMRDPVARRKLRWKSYRLITIMLIGGAGISAIIAFAVPFIGV